MLTRNLFKKVLTAKNKFYKIKKFDYSNSNSKGASNSLLLCSKYQEKIYCAQKIDPEKQNFQFSMQKFIDRKEFKCDRDFGGSEFKVF